MKKIKCVIITIAAALLFFGAVSYAQLLSDWEKGVFQDLAETWHRKLYEVSSGTNLTEKDYDDIFREVARRNNISVDQVREIDNRGLDDISDLWDDEYKLFGELRRRLYALPSEATAEDEENVHDEVAQKYGISIARLHWIEYKMYEGI